MIEQRWKKDGYTAEDTYSDASYDPEDEVEYADGGSPWFRRGGTFLAGLWVLMAFGAIVGMVLRMFR